MTNLRFGLLAAAIGLTSTAALAEPPTGSRLGDYRRPGPAMTERDKAVGAKDMAECLYNRKTDLARQTLLSPTRVSAEAGYQKLLGNVQCFGAVFSNDMVEERHVAIPQDILRGMLAEAALGRSRAQAETLQALPLQKVYQRNWFAVTGRHVTVDEMGACIADTNPGGILTLARTVPTSKEENAAFGGLMDSLGKCLRAGTRLQAGRQALRAALAEALYQRLNAPAPTVAAAPASEAAKD
jgi:hypothetical protein